MRNQAEETQLRLMQPREPAEFLPEPPAESLFCPLISVDDHLLEPLNVFEGRVPARYKEDTPTVTYDEDDCPWWIIDDDRVPVLVVNGAVGRPMRQWKPAPARYDEMRPGVWDPKKRLNDMDLCGIWASLCFGSLPWGFAGSRFSSMKNNEAGLAAMRAYNDWMLEDWCGAAPERYIPCQYTWLGDPHIAAAEIRKNAARGFKAVSFAEDPEPLGFPNIYDPYWDPFFDACQETETVVNLHVGSSGTLTTGCSASPADVYIALFPVSAMRACIDWIYARVPLRFPRLRIALSEGGASWVPMAIERLDRSYRQVEQSMAWSSSDPNPVGILKRNFWFCSIEDPSVFAHIDLVGSERIMVETDYPHQDSTWPNAQAILRRQVEGVLPQDQIRKVAYGNAARLYRHPEPPTEWLARSEIGKNDVKV